MHVNNGVSTGFRVHWEPLGWGWARGCHRRTTSEGGDREEAEAGAGTGQGTSGLSIRKTRIVGITPAKKQEIHSLPSTQRETGCSHLLEDKEGSQAVE